MGAYSSGKRIFYFDVLRSIAIICVIMCHVCRKFCEYAPAGTFRWLTSVVWIDIGVMGVPIFLMISGALLLNRNYDLGDFMKRRFSRILIPFIFWAMLLPLAKIVFLGYPATLKEYFILLFLNQYWFVWMLIGLYLILPIMNSFVREYNIKGLEYMLIIWFIMIIFLRDQPIDLLAQIVDKYSLGWKEFFAGYIGFIPLGYYLSVKDFKLSDKTMYIIGLVVFLVFTAINFVYTCNASMETHNIMFMSYRRVVSTMQVIGLFIFMKYFSQYCEGNPLGTIKNKIYDFFKENKYVSGLILSVSVCSYGMFLVHYFWLYLLVYISENIFPIFSRNPVILPLVLLVICALAWLTTLVLSKLPVLKHISGAH